MRLIVKLLHEAAIDRMLWSAAVRVFLSSPGDVAEERRTAREIVEKLARRPTLRGRITIEAVSWDDPDAPVPMLANLSPQEALNRGLPTPAMYDLTIVVFWSRMGTPLK
jgi:hypothetical protein